jgi:predicted metal-dependent hydrolase
MTGRLERTLVGGRPLSYRVRRSRRARKMGVHVDKRDGVVVVLPWRTGLKVVPGLLEDWAEWLNEKVEEYGVRHGPEVKGYATGSELLVFGRPRRLLISALPPGRKRPRFDLADEVLAAELAPDDIFAPREQLEKYLRRLARADLNERVSRWSGEIGLYPKKVIVGERTTRWGSCSPRGTLSFCYRLVMGPERIIDAVVAHEICHLAHLNHGKRFYALLDKACPWHREAGRWLKDHHDDLLL